MNIYDTLRNLALHDPNDEREPLYAEVFTAAADEIQRLLDELETERLKLAACGVAALGYFEGCKDKYRSASLDDVLRLYDEKEHLRKELERDAETEGR